MENSMNKIDEDLEPQFRQIYTLSHLEEMSVHCKPGDMGFNFTITVGSSPFKNTSNGSRIEHNPPHAHIFIGNNFSSRFIITDENPPQKKEDLKTVDESDASLSQIGDKLITIKDKIKDTPNSLSERVRRNFEDNINIATKLINEIITFGKPASKLIGLKNKKTST